MEELPIETTTYSFSVDPPVECDRRGDGRHLTLFRVGSICVDGDRELCLVKNISAGGALIRAYSALAPGRRVQIELKEGQPTGGTVTWIRGTDVGIRFDSRVDVLSLLAPGLREKQPRMPRVQVNCIGFVRQGAILHRVVIQNVSQGGVNVQSPNPLAVGAEAMVRLSGLEPRAGVVGWCQGNRFGITFNAVLGLSTLVQWLQKQQR